MADDEIRDISYAMANLGNIDSKIVEHLIIEFVGIIPGTGSIIGSVDTTEKLLLKTLSKEKVDEIMNDIRGPYGRTIWDKLSNVNEHTLATFLKNEYPQTSAVVLSKIRSEHAARVISCLPESYALEVILRMLKLETVSKETLHIVENTLKIEFMANLSKSLKRDPHEILAEVFNSIDIKTHHRFMDSLEERSRGSAERIKELMFTFNDLLRLGPDDVRLLYKEVDRKILILALKGADPLIMDLFLVNMTERSGKMLKEELLNLGPKKMKDIEDARGQIIVIVKDLAARGLISLEKESHDDWIY